VEVEVLGVRRHLEMLVQVVQESLSLNILILKQQLSAVVLLNQPHQAADLKYQVSQQQVCQIQLVGHNGTLRIFR
jgi:hypothetical protein